MCQRERGSRVARALLDAAVRGMPARHRDWARALRAELEAVPAAEQAGFAFSGLAALLRIALLDVVHADSAERAALAAAMALGVAVSALDLQMPTRLPLIVLLASASVLLGSAMRRHAWRCGALLALGGPLLVTLLGYPMPYAFDRGDVWYPLAPCILLSVLASRRARARHA